MLKLKIFLFFAIFLYTINALGQIINLSPKPSSILHNPETDIIITSKHPIKSQNIYNKIKINGSISKVIDFTYSYSNDNKTLILDPIDDFELRETVSIHISPLELSNNKTTDLIDYSFRIKEFNTTKNEIEINNKSISTKGFPSVTVNVNNNPAEGKIFFHNLSALATDYDRFYGIMNNDGSSYFSKQDNDKGLNFTLQKNGYLTFWKNKSFYMMDSSYEVIDSFACKNGFEADWHEFQMTEDNHAFLLAWDLQIVDMSALVPGGQEFATVEGLIIQELDENKNLVFQWRSWDHYEITDAEDVDFTKSYVSYVHGNALDIDTDGNLLLSSRLMNEITKIDRSTGDIIWRLGGKNNDFSFENDEGFCRQHDIRRIENGNITLFDNGVCHSPKRSRAKEYTLDEVNKIATLVWEYEHPREIICQTMGSVQRLSNGNTFINWGELPDSAMNGSIELWPSITEVTGDKEIVYELTFNKYFHLLYRSHRYLWDVAPPTGINDEINLTNADINIYPNPGEGVFTINFDLKKQEEYNISIYNTNGIKVKSYTNLTSTFGNNQFTMNLSDLANGLYYCEIESESIRKTKRISLIH